MAEIYNYNSTIKVPPKSYDPVAHVTISRFNEAEMNKRAERIGHKPVLEVLQECWEQYNGILSCEDAKIAQALGVSAYVNITASKVDVVRGFMNESLVGGDTIPWVINPTPIPTLSKAGVEEALVMVKSQIFSQQGYPGELMPLIRTVRSQVMNKEAEVAKMCAASMEQLIKDQCAEGGWDNAMMAFNTDLAVYPYAVLHGPVPINVPRAVWSGDKLRQKDEVIYGWNCISPWDFWWSPDSPDTQRGTGVFIRQRWTRQQLLRAASMGSYIRKNIEAVLERADRQYYDYTWMSPNPDQRDDALSLWAHCSGTVDVLLHYGSFRGSDLQNYGMTGLDAHQTYQCSITVIDGVTVQICVTTNPSIATRPVFATSFYKTHDRIANYGISQRVRDVERCYMSALRCCMLNAHLSSAPITETDFKRLAKFGLTPQDLGRLVPGVNYLVNSDINQNTPAMRFNMIPSVVQQCVGLMEYFQAEADRVTNVPAALHGTAQGTGANRTFRGAAMFQGNAVRAILAAVTNIDIGVFAPMGTLLYNYNMLFSKRTDIKGDSQIVARGASGIMKREIDRQNAYEILQLVGAVGAQMGQAMNPALITWAFNNVLSQMQVPDEYKLTMPTAAPASAPPGQGLPGPTGEAAPGAADSFTMGVAA